MGSLAHLNKYLRKYQGRLWLGVLFIVLTNLFEIYKPMLVKEALDFTQKAVEMGASGDIDPSTQLSAPNNLAMVLDWLGMESEFYPGRDTDVTIADIATRMGLILCLLYIAIAILKGLFLFFTRQTIIIMSRLIEYDLKNEIYDQYQSLSAAFYRRNNTGDLMNRISEDVSKVRMYLGPAVMYTINLLVLGVLAVSFMVNLNAELTLYVLAPLPIMSILIYKVSKVMNRRSEAVQRQQSRLSTIVQDSFAGIRVLKAFGREGHQSDFFAKESEKYRDLSLRRVQIDAFFMPTIILLIGISTILAIFIGGRMLIQGVEGFTFGDLVAFVIYVNMLTWPFAAIGWVTSLVQGAAASQERINEFLDEQPEVISGDLVPKEIVGHIQFENVHFTYPESGVKAMKGVSFQLAAGQTLGVFGRTGSGKSTIINLITRQFDPHQGQVSIDGIDLRELDAQYARDNMGLVPQEVFLFSDTITKNIAFGMHGEVDKERVIQAAKEAQVHDDIMGFKDGYDTLLGEWGITLSGGQKQRVSLARAIIKRPQILLFDDSLSAVDTQTEELILQTLDQLITGRTTVLVSHRVSTVKRADHIIVVDEGQIAEQGDHETLMALNGFYARMERRQNMEMAMEANAKHSGEELGKAN